MTAEEIILFNKSLKDIERLQDELKDLNTRITMALDRSTKAQTGLAAQKQRIEEALREADDAQKRTGEAQRLLIDSHIKGLEKLHPIVKTALKEIQALSREDPGKDPNNPKNYDMKQLLSRHTKFFIAANKFTENASTFRLSLYVNNKLFYKERSTSNISMQSIDGRIENAINRYNDITIAYRKFQPYY